MEGIVVVFDFDKTIIDLDSDNWVVDSLGFTDLFNELLPTMPWNSMMDKMMKEMHEQGVTIEDIVEVLHRTPMHPRIVPAIEYAYAAGCDLRILSDANQFYIETILKHLGLQSYFSEIETNPGYVDEEGKMRIKPHHDFTKAPHGCKGVCPPNMCKGFVIERMLSQEPKKKFIYLGDGTGDYCPSTKLREGDIVMPRKNFPLWDLIVSNPKKIEAQLHQWTDGAELEKVLVNVIADLLSSPSLSSSDEEVEEEEEQVQEEEQQVSTANTFLPTENKCKFGNLPLSSHEVLPQAMPVPH